MESFKPPDLAQLSTSLLSFLLSGKEQEQVWKQEQEMDGEVWSLRSQTRLTNFKYKLIVPLNLSLVFIP